MKNVKSLMTVMALLCGVTVFAQRQFELPLYPGGVPDDNGLEGQEVVAAGNRVGNVTNPTVTVCLPEGGGRNLPAVVVCPGGGYARLSMDNEGFAVAKWLNREGIAAVILKYRMPNGHCTVPLSDAQAALEMTRAKASEWGIDPAKVGIMGFSAGGHLAATATTMFTSPANRPDFSILIYPVITLDEEFTHWGTRTNLIGGKPNIPLVRKYSNELNVTPQTPTVFIALSDDDRAVPSKNSTLFYDALKANGVAAELHIYPTGGHGWGFANPGFKYREEFSASLRRWLRERTE